MQKPTSKQRLKCDIDCKSVSGTISFRRGFHYWFTVVQNFDNPSEDEKYDCVLLVDTPLAVSAHVNQELVASRYFSEPDTSFIDKFYEEESEHEIQTN